MDGNTKLVENLYRCLSCSKRFIDEEREFCQAPPFTAALALLRQQRLHEAAMSENRANPYLKAPVIAKALELSGQEPNKDIQEVIKASQIEEEGTIDWSHRSDEEIKDLVDNQKLLDSTSKPMSAAEAAIRKEWADASLNGYQHRLPTVKEYLKRRMNGETFEGIIGE